MRKSLQLALPTAITFLQHPTAMHHKLDELSLHKLSFRQTNTRK